MESMVCYRRVGLFWVACQALTFLEWHDMLCVCVCVFVCVYCVLQLLGSQEWDDQAAQEQEEEKCNKVACCAQLGSFLCGHTF